MMQPTMKLRWIKRKMKVDPAFNVYNGHPTETVLQQWWEGAKIKKEYEHLAPGSLIPYDGSYPLITYEPCGEWRDIEIQNE